MRIHSLQNDLQVRCNYASEQIFKFVYIEMSCYLNLYWLRSRNIYLKIIKNISLLRRNYS